MNKKILIAVIAVIVVAVSVVAYLYLTSKPIEPTPTGQFSVVFSPDEVTVKLNETKTVTITLTSDGYEGKAVPFITGLPVEGSVSVDLLGVHTPPNENPTLESDSVVNVTLRFKFSETWAEGKSLPYSTWFTIRWYGNFQQDGEFVVVSKLTVEVEE